LNDKGYVACGQALAMNKFEDGHDADLFGG